MATVVLFVLVVVLGVGTMLAVTVIPLRAVARRGRSLAATAAAGDPEARVADVRSFGVASAGAAQVRGTGTLVLASGLLTFTQWLPSLQVRVPLASVTRVDTTASHLGTRSGELLLRVAWCTEAGADDSIALEVADLRDWLAALRAAGAPVAGGL